MAIRLKKPEQIQRMCAAGQIVRHVLDSLGSMIRPGVTTKQLDDEAERLTIQAGAECLFKGVPGKAGVRPFPGSICASINDEVVHGIPGARAIREGDIISIDFGVRYDDWCGDAAETFIVGKVDSDVRRLVEVTRNSLAMMVAMVRPGEKWSNIAGTVQDYVEGEGFSVVREFVGHGIGQDMHEDPKVPNYVSRELQMHDIHLTEGMVLAVEPMVNMGGCHVVYAPDGWTVVTKDGKPSAHFEHTIAVVSGGVEVLTKVD